MIKYFVILLLLSNVTFICCMPIQELTDFQGLIDDMDYTKFATTTFQQFCSRTIRLMAYHEQDESRYQLNHEYGDVALDKFMNSTIGNPTQALWVEIVPRCKQQDSFQPLDGIEDALDRMLRDGQDVHSLSDEELVAKVQQLWEEYLEDFDKLPPTNELCESYYHMITQFNLKTNRVRFDSNQASPVSSLLYAVQDLSLQHNPEYDHYIEELKYCSNRPTADNEHKIDNQYNPTAELMV